MQHINKTMNIWHPNELSGMLTAGSGNSQAAQNYRRLMRRVVLYTSAGVATGVALYFSYRWVQARPTQSSASISAAQAAADIEITLRDAAIR